MDTPHFVAKINERLNYRGGILMYLRGTYFGCNLFIVFGNNFVIIRINGIALSD